MKKILTFLILLTSSFINAQVAGDLFIGARSDISNIPLSEIRLSSTVAYQFTNTFQFGVNFSSDKESSNSYNYYSVYGRYYSSINRYRYRGFLQAGTGTSFSDPFWGLEFGAGITAFLGRYMYIEPILQFSYLEAVNTSSRYGINIVFGIRL